MPEEPTAEAFREIGASGLKHDQMGNIHEDYLRKFKNLRSKVKVIEEMQSDSTISAILLAIEMHIRQVDWWVDSASDRRTDRDAADLLEYNINNMDHTWQEFQSEVLSMIPYGFHIAEQVYKQEDGVVMWKRLPPRSQDSVWRWEIADNGDLEGFYQRPYPYTDEVFIPWERMLLFRPSVKKNSPEGLSSLRGCYKAFYYKKKLETIEAIGIERDLSGFPVLNVPADIFGKSKLAQAQKRYAEDMVSRVRKDEQMGAVLPPNWELELLSATGTSKPEVGEVIARYDLRIAQSLLADILQLGHMQSASYALAEVKQEMLSLALEGWIATIKEVLNRYAVPRLIALNGMDVEELPRFRTEPVEKIDPQKLANTLYRLTGVDLVRADQPTEKYLRDFLGLPEHDEQSYRNDNPDQDNIDRNQDRGDNETRPTDAEGEMTQEEMEHG